MENLYYIQPSTFFINVTIYAILALLAISEVIALVRVPRIAGQRAWRQWLAILPAVVGLGLLAMAGTVLFIYLRLAGDPQYTQQAFSCAIYSCPITIDTGAVQSLELFQQIGSFSTIAVVALAVTVFYGFIALSIGRRRQIA